MVTCTVLILTYKGKHHLEYLLPTVQIAIDNYRGDAVIDVLIIDNGSDEITKQYSQTYFPQFRYQFSLINDFLFSLNTYIKNLTSDYILLLNDDIRLDKELLNELIPIMQNGDDSLFGVSCRSLDWDGIYTTSGVRTVIYQRGWMSSYYFDPSESLTKYTLYPAGGSAIFRTKYFNKLKGFDPLYRPAYYEDADLGIRAWQHGWKVIYHPKAFIYHREGGTTKNYFNKDKLEQTIYKNHILWMIKNVRYPGFLFWFFLKLPYRLIYNFFRNKNQYKSLMQALKQFPQALIKRRQSVVIVPDEVWISQLNLTYSNHH
jgi:GT2 family glycosyltransferase